METRKMPRLSTEQLKERILEEQGRHRLVIENWLNLNVWQPACGCVVAWRWVWPEGNWIMPTDVVVTVTDCGCANAFEHQRYYESGLLERLEKSRRESGNELT